jgi:glutamine amidotransferase
MIAIIDYGVGNLFSLSASLKKIGKEAYVTSSPEEIRAADKIILPGVGAFRDAITKLRESGLDKLILEEASRGKKILGICLGMQMLFEKSYEYGEYEGLGLLKGRVIPISEVAKNVKIPEIGWNALEILRPCPILKYIKSGDFVYFVHSYFVTDCEMSLVASNEYGANLTAVVNSDNIYGCQFHPEKSGEVGLNILRGFCEL